MGLARGKSEEAEEEEEEEREKEEAEEEKEAQERKEYPPKVTRRASRRSSSRWALFGFFGSSPVAGATGLARSRASPRGGPTT